MSNDLTPRQHRVWQFYRDFQHDYGYAPTYRDVMRELGFRSCNAVAGHVKALLDKGHLRRLNGAAGRVSRCIVAVDLERSTCPTCGQAWK